ncbi:MAG: hypothetical protein WDM84_00420 [Bauldia sp.]
MKVTAGPHEKREDEDVAAGGRVDIEGNADLREEFGIRPLARPLQEGKRDGDQPWRNDEERPDDAVGRP